MRPASAQAARTDRPARAAARACIAVVLALAAGPSRAETFNGHTVAFDGARLQSWAGPPDQAFAHVVSTAWEFMLTGVPVAPNGLPTYFSYSFVDADTLEPAEWPHNPAGLNAMLTESALQYFAFSGDPRPVALARELLDHHLAAGMTDETALWPNVPYASADPGATQYRGAAFGDETGRGDGLGFLEPDKVAELGEAFLRMYLFTGEEKYATAAVRCADALARHVRPGDAVRSPWPFRVNAETNAVREEYCANVVAAIRLFDALAERGMGDAASYLAARELAWEWLLRYPLSNHQWAQYFEDIVDTRDTSNHNQLVALETARYLLQHRDRDPDWDVHVAGILEWVDAVFATQQWGATAIGEQVLYNHPMGSHTARHASVNALRYEHGGDPSLREKALRSFNWATYMSRGDGRVIVGPDPETRGQIWWTDGYGDYIRHFLAGMASVPEWAPAGESHLLRSSSVVRSVTYAPRRVVYETSDAHGSERLRLSFAPEQVSGDGVPLARTSDGAGWTYDPETGVVEIRRAAVRRVDISGRSRATGCGCGSATPVDAAAASLLALYLGLRARRRGPPPRRR